MRERRCKFKQHRDFLFLVMDSTNAIIGPSCLQQYVSGGVSGLVPGTLVLRRTRMKPAQPTIFSCLFLAHLSSFYSGHAPEGMLHKVSPKANLLPLELLHRPGSRYLPLASLKGGTFLDQQSNGKEPAE